MVKMKTKLKQIPAPKIRKQVAIESSVHASLKALANRTGKKIEWIAQEFIEAGLKTEGAK